MTDNIKNYFQLSENANVFRNLLNNLPSKRAESDQGLDVSPFLRQILKIILNNQKQFDECCQSNIKWIGSSFVSAASSYEPSSNNDSDSQRLELFCYAYRFLRELEFSMPESLSFELESVKNFVNNNIDQFDAHTKSQLIYANYFMPSQVVRDLLHHPDIVAIREFNTAQKSAASLKNQWDEELEAKDLQLQALKSQLEGLETGFNFVGLVDGFRQLTTKKIKEKDLAFYSLIGLSICILVPLLVEGIFIFNNLDTLEKSKSTLLYLLPPLIAAELMLIYFFRVVLVHFRSIKAQLLQLELRTALCQFIQSYSTYAAQIKEKNPSGLEKFENLIFSGLISSEDNLPSTFDGTEQLAKLIAGIRK